MTFGSALVSGATIVATPPDTDIDNFGNRTIGLHAISGSSDAAVQGAWGLASGGNTWRSDLGGVAAYYGVSSGVGQWQIGGFPGNVGDSWGVQLIDWGVGQNWYPAEIAAAGSLYVRFRFNTVGSSGLANINNTELHLKHFGSPDSWSLFIMATQRATVGDFYRGRIEFIGGTLLGKTDWLADTWYTLEVKQSGTTVQARAWADIESVPAFMVSYTVGTAFPWAHDTADGDSLNWEAVGENNAVAWTADTDRVWFVPA